MCFSIPLKVIKIHKNQAEMEDGRLVRLDATASVAVGDYLEVYANLVVGKLPEQKAREKRRLIKQFQ